MADLFAIDSVVILASAITAMTVIVVFFGKGFKLFRRFVHFLDDFHGEEGRPGIPSRPGFSERLGNVEECMSTMRGRFEDMDKKVSFIEQELHPNHGSSMRDAVDRIQMRIDILEERMTKNVSN